MVHGQLVYRNACVDIRSDCFGKNWMFLQTFVVELNCIPQPPMEHMYITLGVHNNDGAHV